MNKTDTTNYVKPTLEDLGTLASRTESQDQDNADDTNNPDSANVLGGTS